MSSFTWLDYSEKERRKMLEVVDLFKERDTRDELGALCAIHSPINFSRARAPS